MGLSPADVLELMQRNAYIAIPLGLALVLVLAALYLFAPSPSSSTRRSAQRTVLLVGPLAAGKTALFSKLLYGHVPQSHTSIKENEGSVRAKWATVVDESEKGAAKDADDGVWPPAHLALARPLHLVDIPGHARLRTRALAQFLPTASGVVFTIDASNGLTGKNLRDAADHLHIVLSLLALHSSATSKPPLPLLILLTKTDLLSPPTSAGTTVKPKSLALALSRAKQSLARELERHRQASLASTTSAGARLEGLEAIPQGPGAAPGGVKGVLKAFGAGPGTDKCVLPSDEAEVLGAEAFVTEGPFEWMKVDGRVSWAAGSVKGGEGGVDQLWDWVDEL